jgi:hypothetical protein
MSSRFRMLNGTVAVAIVATLAIASAPSKKSVEPATSALLTNDRSPGLTLKLQVVDATTGKSIPARFSLMIDDTAYYPEKLNSHGLRFVSIHEAKKQKYVVTYARGTGVVEIELPPESRTVHVAVAKGFEYLAKTATRKIVGNEVLVKIAMRRWTNLPKTGWIAADEHVHYDRLEPAGDKDWLNMLAGDDLAAAHFMVLKGGKVPGIWAKQYAYGKQGEAFDGKRLIRSGEEYRDSAQGHINLLGLKKIIQPISTGGLGKPPVLVNYPPLLDVFQKARQLGGLGGVAHGASLGRHPTAIVDTVSGGVDFFEIGNAHLYALDLWYRLMNCGYVLPPAAGTDLPNFPFRDAWQPFLGSMRMYVNTAGKRDFESWKRAVVAGKVFITSGPIVKFTVNNIGPGGVVHLPATGGEVTIEAELASPIGLNAFELVRMGQPVSVKIVKTTVGGVSRWRIRKTLKIRCSCWLAVRGKGKSIKAMKASIQGKASWINTDAIAHTGAVRVIVGKRPIRSAADVAHLTTTLRTQREYYRTKARYTQTAHRSRVVAMYEKAITELEKLAVK